jgi:transposase
LIRTPLIQIEALWLAVQPIGMRAEADALLARVVQVVGSAQAHRGYLFANLRSSRIKLLMHDGIGVRCAARRLNQGTFEWPRSAAEGSTALTLTQPQFDALVVGLPWQKLEQMRCITTM